LGGPRKDRNDDVTSRTTQRETIGDRFDLDAIGLQFLEDRQGRADASAGQSVQPEHEQPVQLARAGILTQPIELGAFGGRPPYFFGVPGAYAQASSSCDSGNSVALTFQALALARNP
jgi:hypothetical protein